MFKLLILPNILYIPSTAMVYPNVEAYVILPIYYWRVVVFFSVEVDHKTTKKNLNGLLEQNLASLFISIMAALYRFS